MGQTIQIRRDTASNWTSVNPVLAAGEIGFETDTYPYKYKVGNGSTAWNSLGYAQGVTGAASSIDSEVVLFNGTSGSSLKRATITGLAKLTSGVLSAASAGVDYLVNSLNTNFTKAQRGAFVTLTDAATIAVPIDDANFYRCLLGGNRTLGEPTSSVGSPEGQSGSFTFYQDGTGSRTLAYAWCYAFASGLAPTLTTGKYSKDILSYQVDYFRSSTVTITIATPGVVTWNSHGLFGGQKVQLTTTGALPTGLTANTTYWVIPVNANSFQLATSLANAQAGTAITTSGTQSGTHTMRAISIVISTVGDAR